jgi:N-acetylneuraminic acid mutarotase
MELYDPQTDTWTAIPETLTTARGLHGAARIGDRMYVFGGAIGGGATTGSLEVFDLAAQTWETGPFASMNTSRAAFGHAVFEGRIHVLGGEDGAGNAMSSTEVYDPRTDAWTQAPSLPLALKGPLCIVESDRLTLLGGERSDGTLSDGMLVWASGVDAWVHLDIRLPYPARDLTGCGGLHAWTHKGTPHADAFHFVFGGSDASGPRDGFFRYYSR